MEIPYDNGRIFFKRNPVSRGYAAESGNALTVQAARLFINRIIIHVIKEAGHKGKHPGKSREYIMKKTTDELLELLKNESTLKHYIETVSDNLIKQVPLSDCLNNLIEEKGLIKIRYHLSIRLRAKIRLSDFERPKEP